MRPALLAAAALLVALAVAHSALGERYILVRLFRRQDLPKLFGSDRFTRRTLRFAWHVTSVAWLGFAAILWQLDELPHGAARGVLAAVALTFFVSGVVSLVGSRGRHLSWLAFLAVAALAWFAR
jgi:hypothetical protein